MNPTHDQLLADLEARLRTPETRLDELDGQVARALGVDVARYHAYLAVRAALEARRQATIATAPTPPGVFASDLVLDRSRRHAEALSGYVSLGYQLALAAGDRDGLTVAAHAIGTSLALRHSLDLLAGHAPARGPGRARRVVRRG